MSTSLDRLLDNFNVDMTVDMGEVTTGVVPTPAAIPNPDPSSKDPSLVVDQVPSISPESASLSSKDSGLPMEEAPAAGKK